MIKIKTKPPLRLNLEVALEIRDISHFSSALKRRIAEKMREVEDETRDSTNILCSPKVLEYHEVCIFFLGVVVAGSSFR